MQRDEAETLALRALGWLVGNDELLPVFLGSSGADLGDLRGRMRDPVFLASVLDFLLTDDAWITGFAAAEHLRPESLAAARAALPGGGNPHWT